jgi:hypothetical protein
MWRKNRSPSPGSSCLGTDLNRNFGYKWMVKANNEPFFSKLIINLIEY